MLKTTSSWDWEFLRCNWSLHVSCLQLILRRQVSSICMLSIKYPHLPLSPACCSCITWSEVIRGNNVTCFVTATISLSLQQLEPLWFLLKGGHMELCLSFCLFLVLFPTLPPTSAQIHFKVPLTAKWKIKAAWFLELLVIFKGWELK